MAKNVQVVSLMPIKNMNRAIRFYTKSLGAKLQMRAPGKMRNFWASVSLGAGELWLVAPEKREKRALAYTSLVVSDIRSMVRELQRQRVKFQRATRSGPETRVEGPIAFEPFGAAAFFKDSEGNLLMLWQNMPGA